MRILALGDIVGSGGCGVVCKNLKHIKKKYNIDVCIANGENSAVGNGILPSSANELFCYGVDLITTGNHVFRRKEIFPYIDERHDLLRPYNMHPSCPGNGISVIDMGKYRIGVINLIGTAFFNSSYANPFDSLDAALEELEDCRIRIVDFHAESTGEKQALAYYADGRVSAFFGTHTHVLTADARILPKGTGYITDLGMCGARESVLGVQPDIIIRALKTSMPEKFFAVDSGSMMMNGCIFEIDENSGKATGAEPFCCEINI